MASRSPIRLASAVAFLVPAALTLAACISSNAGAQEMLARTVPPGDAAPTPTGPIKTANSLHFTWEFATHLSTSQYADWLKQHFQDFEAVPSDPPSTRFAKLIDGDLYRIAVTVESGIGPAYVRVELVESSD